MPEGSRPIPDPRVIDAVVPALRRASGVHGANRVVTPTPQVREALAGAGVDVDEVSLDDPRPTGCDGIVLLADELSHAGEHAEGVLAQLVAIVRPGGLVAVSAVSALAARAAGGDVRGFRSDELHRALGHHGVAIDLLCAPGAAGVAAGDGDAPYDPERDRWPGLLDAAPRLLAVGRVAPSREEGSDVFFATLPRKVVAAAVMCRDGEGRLLVVHDTFQGHWTLPGGVVDAHEDPSSAARREAWEEAGVRVDVGTVLGVFSAPWPDRVALVYDARPEAGAAQRHTAVHAHEIDAVAWVTLDEALRRLAPRIAQQVRHCLDHPGGTLHQTSP